MFPAWFLWTSRSAWRWRRTAFSGRKGYTWARALLGKLLNWIHFTKSSKLPSSSMLLSSYYRIILLFPSWMTAQNLIPTLFSSFVLLILLRKWFNEAVIFWNLLTLLWQSTRIDVSSFRKQRKNFQVHVRRPCARKHDKLVISIDCLGVLQISYYFIHSMATNESRKYIWKQFNALRRSTTTADPALKKFHFISSSLKDDDDDDDTEQSSSSSNGAAAASNTPEECAKIIGLIYPLTEPFKQRALRVEIRVPNGYPMQPPEVYMRTTIRHPNIEKDGEWN